MLVLALAALAGCSSGGGEPPSRADTGEQREPRELERQRARGVKPVRCPRALSNCSEARGRIVYVEAVDPDGDGDAHFVLAGRPGITSAGISVVDVKRSLRPTPLPARGDELAAAGPVYRGSYGQRQIEAVAVRVQRAPR